ncbi:DNA repair protein RadA [Kaarinaea lacus]
MAKVKTAFVCSDCGSDYAKWQGRCDDCGAWNTLKEFRTGGAGTKKSSSQFKGYAGTLSDVTTLADIDISATPRLSSGIEEFDRVLGGGMVPGSAILIGGHPGAGKSTLLLQVLCRLAQTCPALYVTGEESLQQVALRAQRLGLPTDRLQMLSETSVEAVCAIAEQNNPKLLVVDSIQVMTHEDVPSAPGSVAQVRDCAAYLIRYAKLTNTILILVGHVTKDGTLAGPKVLEHMIDSSVMLEGSADNRYRTLRGVKNRFGAINEIGVFAMTEKGLREVKNPSAIFLQRSADPAPGSIVMVVWEGTRPILVELQALVDDSHFNNPRRLAVGVDQNRLSMLLAVLHRHGGIQVGDQDVFINVVGGVKVMETSADLALLLAIVSSLRDRPLPSDLIVFGEVGLSGEVRAVPSGQERLNSAVKHGFKRAIVPEANVPKNGIKGMEITGVRSLSAALAALE